MDKKQASTGMGMLGKNVVWWSPNQIALRFFSQLPPTPSNKAPILKSLPLEDINNHLVQNYQVTLQSFTDKDITHPVTEQGADKSPLDGGADIVDKDGRQNANQGEQDLTSPLGKYLFPTSDGTSVIMTFFNLAPAPATASASKKRATMENKGDGDGDDEEDHTVRIVNAFNTTEFITTSSGQRIPLPPASPNWLGGGTQDCIHGCPASPPMPVVEGDPCIDSGYNHIDLASLSSNLADKDGSGVAVFVLDTFPTEDQLIKAAGLANPSGSGSSRNRLLQDMVTGMQFSDFSDGPPPIIAVPPAINVRYQEFTSLLESDEAPRTGKDLYKRLYGYKLPDHGLFVTGIIRDLAPSANIECVRVLNDFGIGRANDMTQALEKIVGRMAPGGDLHGKSVVVNLSMVITPITTDLHKLGFRYKKSTDLREALHQAIISAVNAGAVIVSAAGNDSNSFENKERTGMKGRIGPRYPANFPEVVSVASVTRDEKKASSFSDRATSHEQPNGIATYGGERARPVTPPTSKKSPPVEPEPAECMTGAKRIDAVIGVYSSPAYPKLDAGELDPSDPHKRIGGDCKDYYNAPNTSAWAYWSGSSFSTPMISALVARILQERGAGSTMTSQQAIASIQSSEVSSHALFYNKQLRAHVFPACQCQPVELKEAPSEGSAMAVVE